MSFSDIVGTWGYAAGVSGTVTLAKGAKILQVFAHASAGGATLVIFNGASIPIVSGANTLPIQFLHQLAIAGNNTSVAGSQDLVFTGTDQFFVDFVKAGNT